MITYNIAQKNYDKIAISRNADLFATLTLAKINPEADFDRSLCGAFTYELIIQKINSLNEQQIIQIKFDFEIDHHTIAFNKQGTNIIIHGADRKQAQYPSLAPHHIIEPISLNIPKTLPNKKTLKHYFFQQGIFIKNWHCKQIVQ